MINNHKLEKISEHTDWLKDEIIKWVVINFIVSIGVDSSVILNLIGLVNTRGGPLKVKPWINLFLLKDKQESREVNINCFWTHHTGQALKDNPIVHLDCHLSHYGGHHPINLPLLTSLRPAFPPESKGREFILVFVEPCTVFMLLLL